MNNNEASGNTVDRILDQKCPFWRLLRSPPRTMPIRTDEPIVIDDDSDDQDYIRSRTNIRWYQDVDPIIVTNNNSDSDLMPPPRSTKVPKKRRGYNN